MAIDLLHSYVSKELKNTAKQNNVKTAGKLSLPQNLQVMRAIRSLQAGQTLRGEIVSVDGENVQLAVMKDVLVDAKLSGSMNLTPGMVMSFQVKSNQGNSLSLMPLFTNTAADPNALKALDMAGIPANERSVEMVQTLMEKGMPIDKQSLQNLYREVVANKDAAVRDIVTLHQLEIPVTASHLEQLSLYENNQHFLGNTFADMGQALGDQLAAWLQNGDVETAKSFLQNLQQIFAGEQPVLMEEGESPAENTLTGTNPKGTLTEVNPENPLPTTGKATVVFTEEMLLSQSGPEETQGFGRTIEAMQSTTEEQSAANELTKEGLQRPSEQPAKEEAITAKSTEEGSLPVKEAADANSRWKQLTELLSKEKSPEKIAEAFKKVWEKDVRNQWMLEPETVADKEKMQDFYEKLTKQVKQLESLLEHSAGVNHSVSKAVQNTASNLDFMNQLNQMSAYIQLPLKLANQNAHGELYVYTNKRSLAKQEGKVTALLHLTMENLGNMDIYVSLENQKVGTKFTLENEEALDFLEAHMDILTQRLQKRGYDCDIRTSLRTEEAEPILKQIEKQAGSPILLSTQAFDMRA